MFFNNVNCRYNNLINISRSASNVANIDYSECYCDWKGHYSEYKFIDYLGWVKYNKRKRLNNS